MDTEYTFVKQISVHGNKAPSLRSVWKKGKSFSVTGWARAKWKTRTRGIWAETETRRAGWALEDQRKAGLSVRKARLCLRVPVSF